MFGLASIHCYVFGPCCSSVALSVRSGGHVEEITRTVARNGKWKCEKSVIWIVMSRLGRVSGIVLLFFCVVSVRPGDEVTLQELSRLTRGMSLCQQTMSTLFHCLKLPGD